MDVFQYNLGLPGMIILVAKDFATNDPAERESHDYDFNVISYSPDSQGAMNYPNIVKFLYGVNHQFRKTLPGMNLATEDEIMEMEEELEIEKLRFNVRYVDKLKEVVTYDPFQVNVKRSSGTKSDTKKSDGSIEKGKKKKGKQKEGKNKDEKGEKIEKEFVSPEMYEERKFGKKSGKHLHDKIKYEL